MELLGLRSGSLAAWMCAAATFGFQAATARAQDDAWGNARILYAEPFESTIDPRPALMQKRTSSRVIKFDAFGRRLELTLEPNSPLEAAGPSRSSAVNLYRGELTGIKGSWARVATRGSDVHGLIWDGTDLYVIEPTEAVRSSIVPPVDASATKTVLFRLSDTILNAGAGLCGTTATAERSALDSYTELTHELASLRTSGQLQKAADTALRVEISALGDAQFRAQFESDSAAIDQMLLRLNNVDGIFAAELGIQVQVPTAVVHDAESDPLPATNTATNLLRQLASLRAATPQLKARGLTHLFTGRDLDGTTVGIGYIDSLCDAEFGVALTEIRGRGAWLESLVAAHEIGHNFGAAHDGEPPCGYVPQNEFLMSPTVHPTKATFSNCSRTRILQKARGASCVTALPPADLAIAEDLGTLHAEVERVFQWELPVTNVGGHTSSDGRVEVILPSSLTLLEAWFPGGTCTSGGGAVDCELGSIGGGVTRTLHLTLSARDAGTHTVSARIIAAQDAKSANNSGTGTIVIEAQRPTAVIAGETSLPASPARSGGGGGSFGIGIAAALLLLFGHRTARRFTRTNRTC
jgi:hypothetical protein